MRALQKLHDGGRSAHIEIDMVGDSLYHWHVMLLAEGFPSDCPLTKDFAEYTRKSGDMMSRKAGVLFDVVYPPNFPYEPPFIRFVYPRFQFHTGMSLLEDRCAWNCSL